MTICSVLFTAAFLWVNTMASSAARSATTVVYSSIFVKNTLILNFLSFLIGVKLVVLKLLNRFEIANIMKFFQKAASQSINIAIMLRFSRFFAKDCFIIATFVSEMNESLQ